MNRRNLFITICTITLGIAALAMSQTYFEDNFDDPKESESEMGRPLTENGNSRTDEYHQLAKRRIPPTA